MGFFGSREGAKVFTAAKAAGILCPHQRLPLARPTAFAASLRETSSSRRVVASLREKTLRAFAPSREQKISRRAAGVPA